MFEIFASFSRVILTECWCLLIGLAGRWCRVVGSRCWCDNGCANFWYTLNERRSRWVCVWLNGGRWGNGLWHSDAKLLQLWWTQIDAIRWCCIGNDLTLLQWSRRQLSVACVSIWICVRSSCVWVGNSNWCNRIWIRLGSGYSQLILTGRNRISNLLKCKWSMKFCEHFADNISMGAVSSMNYLWRSRCILYRCLRLCLIRCVRQFNRSNATRRHILLRCTHIENLQWKQNCTKKN